MFTRSALTVAALSLFSARAVSQNCAPCEDVHFFLARGNNEPYPGRQGDLVAATCDGVASCGYEDLIYSALYTDLSCQTTYDGTIAGFRQLASYADRCPDSKLILAGYSQGAQIVTDILGGGGGYSFNECLQPSTPPLDRTTSPGNRLSAALVFGNTRHTANQPYNFDNGSSIDGLFPRSGAMLPALEAYTDILRDWCLQTDPICAANQTDSLVSTHLGYYNIYSQAAAAWIKSVAGITNDDPTFSTSIATGVSGTAQDYATIPSGYTPTGTVVTAPATATDAVDCPGVTGVTAAVSSPSGNVTAPSTTVSPTVSATTVQLLTSSATPSITNSPSTSAPPTASADASNDATAHTTHLGFGLLVFGVVAMLM